jgi:hypothetical protein
MKLSKTLSAITVVSAFALVPAIGAASESHAHGAEAHKLTLDNGQKWRIDQPLRVGMESIRDQVTQMHLAAERAPLKPEYYHALGASIQNEIGDIVRNCKLDPAADANFHILLGRLEAAAESLKRKDARRGMKEAFEALEHYGRFFDHPGWQQRA